jgi:hypothetical protein
MKRISIECPECKSKGLIEITEETFKESERGITSILIEKDQVCTHNFIIYLDNNSQVRDIFIPDFEVESPQMDIEQIEEPNKISESKLFDLILIKLNLLPITLAFIIKGVLFKKKIVLLNNETSLHSHFFNFIQFIFENSFSANITILTKKEYELNKKKYKNYVIIERKEVSQDKKKLFDSKKIKVERTIVQKFYQEHDTSTSMIILRSEIRKACELSRLIKKFVERQEKGKNINIINISEEIENVHHVKVNRTYLDFLINIVKVYFETNIPLIYDSFLDFY